MRDSTFRLLISMREYQIRRILFVVVVVSIVGMLQPCVSQTLGEKNRKSESIVLRVPHHDTLTSQEVGAFLITHHVRCATFTLSGNIQIVVSLARYGAVKEKMRNFTQRYHLKLSPDGTPNRFLVQPTEEWTETELNAPWADLVAEHASIAHPSLVEALRTNDIRITAKVFGRITHIRSRQRYRSQGARPVVCHEYEVTLSDGVGNNRYCFVQVTGNPIRASVSFASVVE